MVAACVWAFDYVSKNWAINYLAGKTPRKILGNLIRLTFTRNSGAAFSFATGAAVLLALFSFAVILGIGYWSPRLTSRSWALVFGLVLGGTLGNLSDRILRANSSTGPLKGEVIDWIQLPHWPIFNLADSSIVIAAIVASYLALHNIAPVVKDHPSKKNKDEGSDVT